MTQQLPLILSLIALSLGGYSVVSQPSTGAVETDDVRVKALQEEMEEISCAACAFFIAFSLFARTYFVLFVSSILLISNEK